MYFDACYEDLLFECCNLLYQLCDAFSVRVCDIFIICASIQILESIFVSHCISSPLVLSTASIPMSSIVSTESLNQIFYNAHTAHGFQAKPVDEALLHKALELAQLAPTAYNTCPKRVVFVKSAEGKEKLNKCLMEGNIPQTSEAPVTAIVCFDTEYIQKLPELSPFFDAKAVFDANPAWVQPTMVQNGNLQGGYLILALRAVGLDVGPMSGFDNAAVDAAFLQGTTWKSNFLINIGHANAEKNYPRGPRLAFENATKFA